MPKVNGVGRLPAPDEVSDFQQAERVIEVYFNRRPTDDELRAFHDYVREFHTRRNS